MELGLTDLGRGESLLRKRAHERRAPQRSGSCQDAFDFEEQRANHEASLSRSIRRALWLRTALRVVRLVKQLNRMNRARRYASATQSRADLHETSGISRGHQRRARELDVRELGREHG